MDGTAKTARFSDDLEESKESEEDIDEEEQDDQLASLPRMPKATAPKSTWQIHQEYNSMRNLNVNSVRTSNSFYTSTKNLMFGATKDNEEDTAPEEESNSANSADHGGEGLEVVNNRERGCCSKFCALMDKYPITFIISAALIGIGIGVALSFWQPEDPASKATTILWVGLVGDLFIRALKCIVLPLVFVSIAISVMDMLSLGKAGKLVGSTIGLYLLTTLCAALIGVICSLIFSQFYTLQEYGQDEKEGVPPDVRIACQVDETYQHVNGESWFDPSAIDSWLTEQEDGSIVCAAGDASGDPTLFRLDDVNGYYQQSIDSEQPVKLSLSESIYQGLFLQLVDTNMIGMFANANFLGVIVLGAGFGIALNKLSKKMPDGVNWERILSIQLMEELMEVFMYFIQWIIKCTPFAVISMIAKALGQQSDIVFVMEQLGFLVAAFCIGLVMQVIFVYFGLYIFFVRKNPFRFLKTMVPAHCLAFASASSAATLPVTIDCAVGAGSSDGVARFCIPLGATINMDGGAIYIICASVWLAYNNGIIPTAGDYILLVICATFGSMGTAPVPSAVIILILTSYATTFGSPPGGGEPAGLAYLFAIDWLLDRFRTVVNVTGDLTVTAVVSKRVNEDPSEDTEVVDKLGE